MKSSTRRNRRSFRPSGIDALEKRCMLSNVTGFTVKDLGIAQDVGGLNNYGQVVGTLVGSHAFISEANGGQVHVLIEPSNVSRSYGYSINDYGQIVGMVTATDQHVNRAFFTDSNGSEIHDISAIPNGVSCNAQDINNKGQITGVEGGHAFFYDTLSGKYNVLTDFDSAGLSINSDGQISGYTGRNQYLGFITRPNGGQIQGIKQNLNDSAIVYDINDKGVFIGRSFVNQGSTAFIAYPNNGQLNPIGELTGSIYGYAISINNNNDVVGFDVLPDRSHGFYYDGEIHNLDDMVPSDWKVLYANGINDSDQIAALALDASGNQHAVLLTPIKSTPTITWSNQADIVYGTKLSSTQLNASASVAGTFTYTLATPDVGTGLVTHAGTDRPAAGVALNAGASQIITETFVPDDLINYTTVTTTASINVQKAPLRIVVDDQVACVGRPIPALTMSVTGLVNGDANEFIPTTTAVQGSPVGEYTIHFTTPAVMTTNLDNYSASFVDGKLTIYNPVHLFNEAYYLNRYPDVAAAVKNGWIASGYAHFIKFGVMTGYVGTTEWLPAIEKDYLSKNPSVAAYVAAHKNTTSGYADFVQYGQAVNRPGSPVIAPQSVVHLYDEATYLARYPNVAAAVRNGWISSGYAHFIQFGLDSGYNGSPDWTPAIESAYLTANPDVAIAVQNHWIVSGYAHFVKYHSLGVRPGSPLIL